MPSSPTALDRIRIVLCDTTHTGNMGASARAMKTMGLEQLVFVNPQNRPDDQAIARATGASDLLLSAPVVTDLDSAIEDCQLVFGSSARSRSIGWPTVTPEQAANIIAERDTSTKIAFLFGKEQYGLTNAQLDRCQYLVQIPANPEFSSLNLASAVQLISYQLRVTLLSKAPAADTADTASVKPSDLPASNAEFEGMFDHLTATLSAIEFVDLDNPGKVLRRIRALLQRAELSRNEAAIIRGICSATVPQDNQNGPDRQKNSGLNKDEVNV